MLSGGCLVLLVVAVLNANRIIVDNDQRMYEAEAYDLAATFARELFAEAAGKKFDKNMNPSLYQSQSEWASTGYLGPDGENFTPWPDLWPYKSIGTYDDVDDYNGYQRTVDTDRIIGFKLTSQVYYVTKTDPNTISAYQTDYKRLDVTVEHPSYLKPIKFSTIVSY